MFPSARAKIDRARQHLDCLQDEIRRFLDSHPYRVVIERDREAGELHVVYYPDGTPDPAWPLIVGDIMHNLRSALDHVVHDLSGGADMTEFPIYADVCDFYRVERYRHTVPARGFGLHKIRAVSDNRAWFFIEGMQPYNAGKNAYRAALWVLHELNNIDKHRTLHVCRRQTDEGDIQFVPDIVHRGCDIQLTFGPMEQRTVLSRWRAVDLDTQVDVKGELSLKVTFDKGAVAAVVGEPVEEVCRTILLQVTEIVDGIEAVIS